MKKCIIIASLLLTIPWLPSCKLLQRDRTIEVLSIARVIDKTAPGYEMCSSFTLTKREAETYFSIAEEVTEHEFHYEAIIFPCIYKGSIRIHDDHFQWEVGAGGAGYLYNKDSVSKKYLCRNSCCDSLPKLC